MEYLSTAALTAAGAVVLVQEILKLNIVPGTFANRWPVPTNIILSIIATIVVVRPVWDVNNLPALIAQIGTVAVVAAITYNQLLRSWVKPVESK
ncbi:hypothetical protein [Mycolicibacterium neoaurum]|uniref:hypothetical protein n=1 Tax=Mycolicibacterium neoaurum TaxID=1795 RepID=UPI001F4CE226|nr:hypothetical protein [Mycolicibacterium neoaurum]